MAIIYSYPLNDNIKPLDELVGTTEQSINGQLKTVTRNFLLQDLAEFFVVDGGLQKTITLTTSGTSGAATLNQVTGVLNIPRYSGGGGGSQNLEQVLDEGNISNINKGIYVYVDYADEGALNGYNSGLDGIGVLGLSDNTGGGVGVYAQSEAGAGVLAFGGTGINGKSIVTYGNGSVGIEVNLGNANKGLVINSGTSSTGNFIELNKNGVDKFTINQQGEQSIVKIPGGLPTQYLMADGSVTTGGAGSQNLQQVLNQGNTSSTGITFNIGGTQGILINLEEGAVGLAVSTIPGGLTSYPLIFDNGSYPYFQVDYGGNLFSVGSLEAYSFVKSGGLGTQILAANGDVIIAGSNITIADGIISSTGGGSSITLSAIGSSPNASGATIAGSVLNLEPASGSFGGVITTGIQTIAGFKTFTGGIEVSFPGNTLKLNSGQGIALDVIGGNNANAIAKFTRVSDSVEVARIDSLNLKLQLQTASTIASFDANKNVVSLPTTTYPSLAELTYLKNVTGAIQTQFSNKQPINANLTSISALTTSGGPFFVKVFNGNYFLDNTEIYKEVAEQSLSGSGFSATGGTLPSGTQTHSYRWSQIGNLVTVRINLQFQTAGTCSGIAIPFANMSDIPQTPQHPSIYNVALDMITYGAGNLANGKGIGTFTVGNGTSGIRIKTFGPPNTYEFVVGRASNPYTNGWIHIQYYI